MLSPVSAHAGVATVMGFAGKSVWTTRKNTRELNKQQIFFSLWKLLKNLFKIYIFQQMKKEKTLFFV